MFRLGLMLLSGIAFVVAGFAALGNPALTGVLLMVLIAFNLISDGGRALLGMYNLRGTGELADYPQSVLTVMVLRAGGNLVLGVILVLLIPQLELADLVVLVGWWVVFTQALIPAGASLLLWVISRYLHPPFGCRVYGGLALGLLLIALAGVIASVIKALAGVGLILVGLVQVSAALTLWRMGDINSLPPPQDG